jgi:hypothetical protein
MAKAKIAPVLPVPPPPFTVILELSLEEAKAILALVGRVTGGSETSRRKYTTPVYYALDGLELDNSNDDLVGSVFFKSKEDV